MFVPDSGQLFWAPLDYVAYLSFEAQLAPDLSGVSRAHLSDFALGFSCIGLRFVGVALTSFAQILLLSLTP